MKYCVEVTNAQYGYVHVEAESSDEAKRMAKELYDTRQIDWYDERIDTIVVHEE